jgi:hypothetical protein
MTWLFSIAAWMVLIFFISQVAVRCSAISRCSSVVNNWTHVCSGCGAIGAIAVLWNYWTWLGLVVAIAVYLAAEILTAVLARLWVIRLLRQSPDSADSFMRDQ